MIQNIIIREREKAAKEPYITSTLQQEASSKLGFNAKKTMMIAQKLYEGVELKTERVGLITYMRTDSYRLSQDFINEAKGYIEKEYGKKYYKGYFEKNKGKNVQDAHEAIRPTRVSYHPDKVKAYLDSDEAKLYTLIYERAIASLMANAVVEDQKVLIENNGYIFEANGEKIIFDGYIGVYKDPEEDAKSLPDLKEGQVLKNTDVTSEQKFTNPPLRYNEARLIRKMEELGIGRPSTYAMTIETLKARNYVKLEKKCFVPTKQGELTSEKLSEFFDSIINVKYTAQMEETLDKIARGEVVWYSELKNFYNAYIPLLNKATNEMKKIYPIYLDEVCPKGYKYIAGCDEAGRGPMAGPLVAASVILPIGYKLDKLDDSKKLTKKVRDELYDIIMRDAVEVKVSVISVSDVDRLNVYMASKKAMTDCVLGFKAPVDYVLTDCMPLNIEIPVLSLVKGDSKSASIAAASVIAKVTRDTFKEFVKKLVVPEFI